MNFRNAFSQLFGNKKNISSASTWHEIGNYNSTFTPTNVNVYANEIARSCIRTLAEHSSKANVKALRRNDLGFTTGDRYLERLLQYRPNLYMNGKDFLYKVRTRLEIDNTAFIYINRDETGKVLNLYPLPKAICQALEVTGRLYIKFTFATGKTLIASYEDLAILRKDYNNSDIFGDDNNALYGTLDLLHTLNQGQANAIKATANLRGILKSTKAMLSDDDIKKNKDTFVKDYLNLENEGGIASLDATQEFTPINMQPATANFKQIEELRNNIYRYFGVNEAIITSQCFGDAFEAFYESRLEPFLLALSLELTNKIFTARERGFGNEIVFEANRLAYASTTAKLSMVQLLDRGVLTINEYREILNLAPVDGGDIRPIRKEYTDIENLDSQNLDHKNPTKGGENIDQ